MPYIDDELLEKMEAGTHEPATGLPGRRPVSGQCGLGGTAWRVATDLGTLPGKRENTLLLCG